MKDLAADESLSEEARDSARKALDVLVSSQLLEIEQAAALKKLEVDAQFAQRQAQVERKSKDASVQELEAEAQYIRRQAEAEQMKAEAERLKARADIETEAQGQRSKDRSAAIIKLDAEADAEMTEWLGRHRLLRHAEAIARVAGPDAAPSDPVSLRALVFCGGVLL